jgi:hypothetical protein
MQNFETSKFIDSVVTRDAVDRCVIFGLAVAVDAPPHVQGGDDFDHFHAVDLPMALAAVDAASDMGCVTELCVVGKIVDFHPAHGSSLAPVLMDLLHFRVVPGNFTVAVHAGVDARDDRLGAFSSTDMTESTGDLMDAGMKLMAELDGLLGSVTLAWIETGRKSDGQREQEYSGDDKVACTHTSNDSLSHKISKTSNPNSSGRYGFKVAAPDGALYHTHVKGLSISL